MPNLLSSLPCTRPVALSTIRFRETYRRGGSATSYLGMSIWPHLREPKRGDPNNDFYTHGSISSSNFRSLESDVVTAGMPRIVALASGVPGIDVRRANKTLQDVLI